MMGKFYSRSRSLLPFTQMQISYSQPLLLKLLPANSSTSLRRSNLELSRAQTIDLFILFIHLNQIMSKQVKQGPIPIEERKCTDVCCLIFFLVITIGLLGLGIYAWTNGNFKRLTTAYDPDGKGCGVDYPNYPYIYFASPSVDSLWVTVCVSKCPVTGDTSLACQVNSVVTTCDETKDADTSKVVQVYDSTLTGNKACLPTSDTLKANIASATGGSTQQISSLMDNYVLIILAFPISIILALIIMLFIRLTASCFIYLLIVVTFGVLVCFGVYLLLMPTLQAHQTHPLIASNASRILIAIGALLLAVLIIVMACCFRKRLALASSIVKVSANFVSSNCGIVFLPLLLFFVMIIFIALWILEALGYYSLGTPKTGTHQYPFQHFDVPRWVFAVGAFHVFYLLWTLFFLIETGSFIVGGAAVSWYYKRDAPYGEASERYRKKHIGSVCLGSFFMALLGFIKFLYELVTPEQKEGTTGCLATYKKFCDCICCLCTSFLFQWFNSGAFSVINLAGDSYCTAAGRAFSIRLNNIGTTSIVTIVQAIFTFLIRLGITFLTVFVIYMLIQYVPSYREKVHDATLILVIAGLIAFTISCFFISVYSDAMDAIYTTYLLEIEAGEDTKYCPPELQEFLEEAKKGESALQ